jgi:hypothetical protein
VFKYLREGEVGKSLENLEAVMGDWKIGLMGEVWVGRERKRVG